VERRQVPGGPEQVFIVGYAAVYDSLSEDLGGFREVIRPGAFDRALSGTDIRALFNHDPSFILGRQRSGTLRVASDGRGLRYEILAPDAQWVRDMVIGPIDRRDLDGSSFGFAAIRDDWGTTPEGTPLRELLEVHPFDVSPVTFPAYLGTADPGLAVALRSLDVHREAARRAALPAVAHPDPAWHLARLDSLRP
jgi:HK97 family phage prohead protease